MSGRIKELATNRFFWIVVLSAGVVFGTAEKFTIAHAQAITPFTIRLEDRAFGHDGLANGELIDVATKARRSDGGRVEVSHFFGKVGFNAGEKVRKITLPTGELTTAQDSIRALIRWNANSSEDRARRKAMLFSTANGCVTPKEQRVGTEIIMGQETVAVVWPSITTRRITEWRALNLGCEPLQARIEEEQADGSYKVMNEISAVSLVIGEPDPSLFSVPPDYADLKPSDFLHKEADKLQVLWNADLEKQANKMDTDYSKLH